MSLHVALGTDALARLMPMHLVVDGGGIILAAGPTLERMRAPGPLRGAAFFDVFAMRRPRGVIGISSLAASGADRVQLDFVSPPHTPLRGHFVPDGGGTFVFDLSFGITVREAVATYGLKATDFAPTSLAVDMLFLAEANAAALAESRDLNRRLRESTSAAERLARTDALTGVGNRRALEAMVEELVERGESFGFMHVDLDYFKSVNDSFGHAAGDHVLNQVARILERETRDGDCVVRLGGDEFGLVFRGMIDPRPLSVIAGRILATFEEPIPYDGANCRISASIGVTTSNRYDVPDVATILRDADVALYRSKLLGRSRATIFGTSENGPYGVPADATSAAASGGG
jgi:diguanylate cyclase (GGDEF)-like protein